MISPPSSHIVDMVLNSPFRQAGPGEVKEEGQWMRLRGYRTNCIGRCPTLAVRDGDLWLMSTPYGMRGFFWEEWTCGGERWERISVPATECSRISPRVLEEERARGGDWFRQEYMCEFGEMAGRTFSQESIAAARRFDIEPMEL